MPAPALTTLKDLAAVATVGVRRAAQRMESGAFCDAAILASVAQRAGHRPGRLESVPPPFSRAPMNNACPRSAAQLLAEIIATNDDGLILEWAMLARERAWTAPPSLLPALLTLAAATAHLRDWIEPILGPRGLWLAKQRGLWKAGVPSLTFELAPHIWETGTRRERFAALRALRHRDPPGARALLESTWSSLAASDRAEGLLVLHEHLSMDDEPWLESCLDDRAGSVQRAAVERLCTLRESRFAKRMCERLSACVSISADAARKWKSGARRGTLILNRPAACDVAMRRDGVSHRYSDAEALRHGLDADESKSWRDDEDWWLMQIIASVAPGAPLSAAPEDLIHAAIASEDGAIALTGWRIATERQRDQAWAAALIETWCLPSGDVDAIERLWRVLSPGQRDVIGPKVLASRTIAKARRADLAIALLDPRCLELSRACLEATSSGVKRGYVDFEAIARGVHRGAAVQAQKTIEGILDSSRYYPSHVAARILPLRARLAEEFPP